ncbi:Mn2+/Fe2+ NRAMP family transporter [Mycobacterium frederiksbergense]|uniref:Mn2+/Fe2+ NRAMP family transporter n=1 Tax=Mycolicibacterium frederiksbergense TaxID=117567 RepID=A0ABT6KZB1_9MYCO|nr:NRAMP family divalent metal transporter [Mycolicibacterium frederiksbergense]MDH6196020.1 Mn2+/Fe2+ NRAMP family transporter [Mycolicibacterium frederiksbergense]
MSLFTTGPDDRATAQTRPAVPNTVSTDSSAVPDTAHTGDIVGALGRIAKGESANGRSLWQRMRMLAVIVGPGLIVMVGDNDAGGVATYAQAGQNYGINLLWTLALLIPVLYVNQEMVVRLGAVTGVGHARLIFERFGRFWGMFSLGDLVVLNALTIVTEFIGVSLALGFLGCPKAIAVPVAAVVLFAVVAGGSFRRWERLLFALIAVNIVMVPMALMVHPSVPTIASGLIPQFPGGLDATLLLLIVAIVGTTVAPWQLFFQQSNIVDKRITPNWIRYARADLWIGIAVVMGGALAIMATAAFGLAGTDLVGQFTDAGAVAAGLSDHAGRAVGVLFAVLLLDASIIGANAVGLATTYAIGDSMGKRHSLHWKVSQAPLFYGAYTVLLAGSAALAFTPDHVQGLITQGVQVLAGVLLPSATVFLVLLCNDRPVLGPWVNSVRKNIMAWTIVWCLVLLSLALTTATLFPDVSASALKSGLVAGAAVGIIGGAVVIVVARRRAVRADADAVAAAFAGIDPEVVEDLDEAAGLTRAERNAINERDRATWRTPALATLARPVMSPGRRAGLLVLRGYLLLAIVLVVVKVVQAGAG